jgi:hypothetical protein
MQPVAMTAIPSKAAKIFVFILENKSTKKPPASSTIRNSFFAGLETFGLERF